jgi:hypothetical protein
MRFQWFLNLCVAKKNKLKKKKQGCRLAFQIDRQSALAFSLPKPGLCNLLKLR